MKPIGIGLIAFTQVQLAIGCFAQPNSKLSYDRPVTTKSLPINHTLLGKWTDGQYGGCSDPDGQGYFVISTSKSYHYDLVCNFRSISIGQSAVKIKQSCKSRSGSPQISGVTYMIISSDKIGEAIGNTYTEYSRCR